ncbi:MAG: hypothetical protein RQ833_11550 [Sphingomonadaceae bacterium]|nr:hypothetical protein [Sphingomonadaceae bacterium]
MILRSANDAIDVVNEWLLDTGVTITGSSWSIDPGGPGAPVLQAAQLPIDGSFTAIIPVGGTPGGRYTISNTVTLSNGLADTHTDTLLIEGGTVVAIDEAKAALGIAAEVEDHDAEIHNLILAAEARAEQLSGVAGLLRTATYAFRAPAAAELRLPVRPVQAVTGVSVRAPGGEQSAWTDWRLAAANGVARLRARAGTAWPSVEDAPDAYEVTAQVGHADRGLVPEAWRRAVTALVVHWFDHRGALAMADQARSLPDGPAALLRSLRRPTP